MADRLTLGIDVGTTAVKTGLIAADGRPVALGAAPYPLTRRTGGIAEQDPGDWIARIEAALARYEAEGLAAGIAAVGLCSQVNTHVFVDADGRPLMPAIQWQDGRAQAEAAELDARVTEAEKIAWFGTPIPIDASHALPRMLWVSRHRPEVWERTRAVLLPKDYCILHLTGELTTDPLSNIGLVDQRLDYVAPLLDLVPGAAERMAPLVPVTGIAGHVRAGALKGRPVVSGTMDAWAGLVGAGGAREGSSVYLSGTSEILGISSPIVVPTPGAVVFPECEGIRLHAGPTQSGGDAQLWFAELTGREVAEVNRLVAETSRSAAVPLFLPQLEGERAPLWDASLRGAFLGLGRATTEADLAWSVYEGVALAARWIWETLQGSSGVRSESITCGGGGFRAEPWNRIRADVFGVPLHRLEAGEPGILGAAAIAAIGTGAVDSFDEASEVFARTDACYAPDPRRHAGYDALFDHYKEAVEGSARINREAARLSAALP